MAETYSVSVGSVQEAESYTSITQVLSLIPDNTSKSINPRDVRDAIFSGWENSVIRFTTDASSNEYIGIDRNGIKSKLFFGKKQLSGTTIMSTSLLGSDTDIFLYNTKSDGYSHQNFKMSLLAGSSQSLWVDAPYLSSVQVNGANGYLGLQIVNPNAYGTIDLQTGTYARIGINGLLWPSRADIASQSSSPLSASASDLFLVVRSGGYVELRMNESVGDTLGSPNSPTYIYGDAELNGYSLEFTDLNPVVATFGGIAIGSTFSEIPLVEIIRQMIYPNLGPLTSISIDSSLSYNSTIEREHSSPTNINYTYTLTKRTNNITSTTLSSRSPSTVISSTSGSTISGSGLIVQSYSGTFSMSGAQVSANSSLGVFTFSVVSTDGTQSHTASTFAEFVHPYFYGFYGTASFSAGTLNTALGSLTKRVDTYTNQNIPLIGTGYLYFMYPSYYGSLDSIYDGNDFLVSGSFTHSTVSGINSPSSKWSSASYIVYRTTSVVTVPSPSQDYKFNFS